VVADDDDAVEMLREGAQLVNYALSPIGVEAAETLVDDEGADGGAAAEVWAQARGERDGDTELLAAGDERHLKGLLRRGVFANQDVEGGLVVVAVPLQGDLRHCCIWPEGAAGA
jgi:hypothetical protein